MTPFEEELKKSLSREEPPPDFTAKVLARVAQSENKSAATRFLPAFLSIPSFKLFTAVVAVLLVFAGFNSYEKRQQKLRAESAKRSLLLAMHVTELQLNQIRGRLDQADAKEALAQ